MKFKMRSFDHVCLMPMYRCDLRTGCVEPIPSYNILGKGTQPCVRPRASRCVARGWCAAPAPAHLYTVTSRGAAAVPWASRVGPKGRFSAVPCSAGPGSRVARSRAV
jgi:hypothetical protein